MGSEGGTLFALHEATGKVAWSQLTVGAITSAAVAHGGVVGIGSSNGTVDDFLIQSGNPDNTGPIGSPIDGLTGTDGIYIVSTSAGLSLLRGPGGTRVDWHIARSGMLRAFVIPGNPVY